MSKTFANNTSRTTQRGRGRGQKKKSTISETRNMDPRQNRQPTEDESSGGGPQPGPANDNLPSRMQTRDAYTVIAPKPEKRQDIAAKAQQEEENYQRYKEQKKLGPVSYVGTAGGGAITEDKSRQRAFNQSKQAAFNVRQKSQQYRDETRKKEMEIHDKMKNEQRKKAESNTRRDSARQRDLKEDHRTRNEDFLRRIEQQNQQKRTDKILGTSAAAAFDTEDLVHSGSTYHQDRTSGPFTSPNQDTKKPSGSPYSRDATDQMTQGFSPLGDAGYRNQRQMSLEEGVSPDVASFGMDPVEVLHQDYPDYDRDILENLLLQCNGRLEKVRDLIG